MGLIIRDFRVRNCICENFLPDSDQIQSWKVNFKTELRSKSADPHLTMQWIKEVEIAKSMDDLVRLPSIPGETMSPTTICLMRWLRVHCKDFSTSMFTSEKEQVSKSSVLKSTTDSHEGDKLVT